MSKTDVRGTQAASHAPADSSQKDTHTQTHNADDICESQSDEVLNTETDTKPTRDEIIANANAMYLSGMAAKDVAESLGQTQTGLYAYLRGLGVSVACVRFLVNTQTGTPVSKIEKQHILNAGKIAIGAGLGN